MKIKALESFVSGRYFAARGEVLDVEDNLGRYLAKIGVAEPEAARSEASKTVEAELTKDEAKAPKKAATRSKKAAAK